MDMMISLKDIGLIMIFIVLLVLLIYLIIMVKTLNETLKNTNEVLGDVKVVTEVAQRRTTEVDAAVSDIIDSVDGFTRAAKGHEGTIQAVSSIAKSTTSLVGLLKKDGNDDDEVLKTTPKKSKGRSKKEK